MDGVQLIEFQREFKNLNLKVKEHEKIFDLMMLIVYTAESDKGFIVKKVWKTTKRGTKVTYKACASEEEAQAYKEKVDKLFKNYKDKYGDNFDLELEVGE